MDETVVFLAIYKTETETVTIEYIPLQNGAIEIVSASIVKKPVSQWEEREQQRRERDKTIPKRRASFTELL